MKPTTVTQYISLRPKDVQKKLKEIRACLKKAAPYATEDLKWGNPAFSYDRILFVYAGFKKHIGFYPTPGAIKEFKSQLTGYKTAKGSIQFPLDEPLPKSLITKIAKFRIKEIKEKDIKWK